MLIRFQLYKKINNKWATYNEVFILEPKSLRYQHALRLIDKAGWIPYRLQNIPGLHEPLKLEGSYDELEKAIIDTDPLGLKIGSYMKEFISQKRGSIKSQTLNKDVIKEKALKQAHLDYKAKRYVLPHLLKELNLL